MSCGDGDGWGAAASGRLAEAAPLPYQSPAPPAQFACYAEGAHGAQPPGRSAARCKAAAHTMRDPCTLARRSGPTPRHLSRRGTWEREVRDWPSGPGQRTEPTLTCSAARRAATARRYFVCDARHNALQMSCSDGPRRVCRDLQAVSTGGTRAAQGPGADSSICLLYRSSLKAVRSATRNVYSCPRTERSASTRRR